MSGKLMGRVWDLDLRHAQQSVLLAMADHADDAGRHVFPSAGLIAWKTGYSKRQVQRIVDTLESDGLLVRVAEARDHRATEFVIDLDGAKLKEPYTAIRGDKVSSRPRRQGVIPPGDEMSPRGVTSETDRGDIAVSPEPSVEPSENHQTPLPPLPRGNRRRDRDRWEQDVRAWASAYAPEIPPDEIIAEAERRSRSEETAKFVAKIGGGV